MSIRDAIAKVIRGDNLAREEAVGAMNEIMSGEATPAQIAGFLIALRCKGETVEEITGCAEVMREKAIRVRAGKECLDTCGTGGDSSGTFNISTAAALVAAGAGAVVAKHGNRSVSSSSGSADVLKELGVNIECDVPAVESCIEEAGIGFLFAPLLHGAMKYAIGPRRELGVRTVFNILGPLTNPAGARRQLLGVFDPSLCEMLANVLKNLGSERVMVVHGDDGLDEISICAPTRIAELAAGEVTVREVTPEDLGVKRAVREDLVASSVEESADIVRGVLDGEQGPRRDIVAVNAGAAIACAGKADTILDGMKLAVECIDSGRAKAALQKLVEVSGRG